MLVSGRWQKKKKSVKIENGVSGVTKAEFGRRDNTMEKENGQKDKQWHLLLIQRVNNTNY